MQEKTHLRHREVIANAKPGACPEGKKGGHLTQLAGIVQKSFGHKGIGFLPMVFASVHAIEKG